MLPLYTGLGTFTFTTSYRHAEVGYFPFHLLQYLLIVCSPMPVDHLAHLCQSSTDPSVLAYSLQ